MSGITVYSHGIVYCSVCAPNTVPLDDVIAEVNSSNPTGFDWGWKLDLEPTFRTGQPNPCACDREPKTHTHYLFHC